MPRLYRNESGHALANAQTNLCGRTHYVDDQTLRFHKSRVISARAACGGLVFAIVTSDAVDYQNTRRGFRYVVFDVFGTVVGRTSLEDTFRKSEQATKAMWRFLENFNACCHTLEAIEKAKKYHAQEMAELHHAAIHVDVGSLPQGGV